MFLIRNNSDKVIESKFLTFKNVKKRCNFVFTSIFKFSSNHSTPKKETKKSSLYLN